MATIKHKGKIISNYIACNDTLSKAVGLMFSQKRTLLFKFKREQIIPLHMLFVFFPIWAVYLNKNKKINTIKKLNPFTSFFTPKKKAKYVIEFCFNPKLKVGYKLSW